MQTSKSLLIAILMLSHFTAARADQGGAGPTVDDEGLAPVKIVGLDHVSARPGANLGAYDKVMLDPVEVSFSKSWKPDPAGGPITAAEKQTIKSGLAKIFRQELQKALQGEGGYALVDVPDANVLRIRAEIRDLYINAPDVPRAGPTRMYALSASDSRLGSDSAAPARCCARAKAIDRP